jgi:hypothetical protein
MFIDHSIPEDAYATLHSASAIGLRFILHLLPHRIDVESDPEHFRLGIGAGKPG